MKFSIFQKNKLESDETLLAKFKATGDMEVLGELYNRYLEMTLGLCLKYFKNKEESEDAVMGIFEIVARRLPNHDVEYFKSWLYRVASNHCLDILRKNKRIQEKESEIKNMYSDLDTRLNTIDIDEEMSENEMNLQLMEQCIETLNEAQRVSIQLFYLEKKSYEEVADALNVSWAQTRSYVQNGRRNIKKCMEQNHESAREK